MSSPWKELLFREEQISRGATLAEASEMGNEIDLPPNETGAETRDARAGVARSRAETEHPATTPRF